MKYSYLLLILITTFAKAQIVTIPDANFKAKLLSASTTNSVALDVNGNSMIIDSNTDGEIQVVEATFVTNLDVSNSNITDLTGINTFINLQTFTCDSNPLTDLTISSLASLTSLSCDFCFLTNITLTRLTLNTLSCQYNNFSLLDLSNITVQNLFARYNPNLFSINLKNGSTELFLDCFIGNGVLRYICLDSVEEADVQGLLNILGMANTIAINSYCFFTPGGNYNTITGTVTFDANNNGCDSNNVYFPNIRVNINDGTNQGATFTNSTGNYSFYTPAGSFDVTPAIENPSWFTITPATSTVTFTDANNNTATRDFCLAANGVHRDVEMVIVPINPARPGFNAVYRLVYKNIGNQTVDVYPNFTYDDDVLDLVSTSVTPFQTNVGGMSWVIPNILPFQSGSIEIVLNVNAPTETPAVNINDVLTFTSFVDITGIDDNWSDNAFTLNQTVVGSYDPNDITCLEGELAPPSAIGEYMHYNVRFENTGTAPAEFVVVRMEVNETDFDVSSLQIMNSSDPVYARINRNIVEFIFQNIQLESGGHGNVLLKVKSKNTLQVGDEVSKKANIYFDYNFPIETNDAQTVFQSLSNPGFEQDNTIQVYPNPAQTVVTIKANTSIQSIQLYDIQGRLLQTNLVQEQSTILDVSEKAKGVYFLKVTSDKGIKVEKLVKE